MSHRPTPPLLPRRHPAQAMFIAAMQRDGADLVPLADARTRVWAWPAPGSAATRPPSATLLPLLLCTHGQEAPVAALYLSPDDLLALGLLPQLTQQLPLPLLRSLLQPLLADWLARVAAALGQPVQLQLGEPVAHWPGAGLHALQAQPVAPLGCLRLAVGQRLAQAAWARGGRDLQSQGWADVPLALMLRLQVPAPPSLPLQPRDWWWPGWRRGQAIPALLCARCAPYLPLATAQWEQEHGGLAAWRVHTMNDASPSATAALSALSAIADATVGIDVQLPAAVMSLRELATLQPGALIGLGCAPDDLCVTLSSAGQAFAQGRLVSVGEQLGVEVSALLTPGA